ncbi:unnamed protein product [Allacma fusca]|uniref:Uncharacterized protein n=1 Tax=Allacma fusca TaxID=39272 RepID=A0A8J2PMG0_9HEXA|nr:unnamed protein product [Allacma fusca]
MNQVRVVGDECRPGLDFGRVYEKSFLSVRSLSVGKTFFSIFKKDSNSNNTDRELNPIFLRENCLDASFLCGQRLTLIILEFPRLVTTASTFDL